MIFQNVGPIGQGDTSLQTREQNFTSLNSEQFLFGYPLSGVLAWVILFVSMKRKKKLKYFTILSYSTLPLGMAAWISFTLSFALTNIPIIIANLSDPLGWGWELFSAPELDAFSKLAFSMIPSGQALVLVVGFVISVNSLLKIANVDLFKGKQKFSFRAASPVIFALAAYTAVLLWIQIGWNRND